MECFTQTFLFVCSCDQSVRLTAEMDPIGDFPPRNNLLQTLPSWIKMHYLHWKNSEKVSTQSVLWVFWSGHFDILYTVHYTLYSIQYLLDEVSIYTNAAKLYRESYFKPFFCFSISTINQSPLLEAHWTDDQPIRGAVGVHYLPADFPPIPRYKSIEEESNRREGKGSRCCLGEISDSIPCRASHFA